MEFESTLEIASRSFEDVQKAFSLLAGKYGNTTAWVWRAVPSYDEMDRSLVRMQADRILYWTPEDPECEKYMEQIAGILGEDGFALLEIGNSVSPDYHDYKVTTPGGECGSVYNQESARDVMKFLEKSYGKDLVSILYKSKDGYKELWNKDRQEEPDMPYKREGKPARTHEQVLEDDYLYRKSDASVEAFRGLLLDRRDLGAAYRAFSEAFEAVKADPVKLDRDDLYILTKHPYGSALYEKVSLGTRLERAEQFTFRGKIFHIHGNASIVDFKCVETDPKLKELACKYEDDLRVAIARRGGIIDDYDFDKNRLKYVDCCVMIDNEDQRYWDWTDKFSHSVNHFGLELVSRFALWYAITRTPEMSVEEREKLADSSFYLDAVEAKNAKVLEAEEVLKAEMEERQRQYRLEQEKEFGELMKLLKEKYGEDRAASCTQIENEVKLGNFKHLSYWTAVKNYIKEKYSMTAAAYFKQEGLTGKKEAAKKEPEKKAPAPKKEPVKKAAPAKKKAEDPLIAFMRSAAESRGLTLEDLLGPEDDGDLDLGDFVMEDDEDDELVLEFKKDVEDIIEQLTKKYNGKPRFASYAALKKENPDVFWEDAEDTIKNYIHSTPAAYFKEAGLVRSGQAKEQLIGKAAEKKEAPEAEAAKKEPVKKEPEKKEPAKKAEAPKAKPAPKKEPAKKAAPKPAAKPAPKPAPAPAVPEIRYTDAGAGDIAENGIRFDVLRDRGPVIGQMKYMNKLKEKYLQIPEGVTEIESGAFYGSACEIVRLPRSLRILGQSAFENCANLRKVILQEGLGKLESNVFAGCPKLTELRLPESLQHITSDSFTEDLYSEKATYSVYLSGTTAARLMANKEGYETEAVAKEFIIDGRSYRQIEDYMAARRAAPVQQPVRQPQNSLDKTFSSIEKSLAELELAALRVELQKTTGVLAVFKRMKLQRQIAELEEKIRNM